MPAKALIQVDLRIEALRDLTSQGKGNAQTIAELQELLRQRGELIQKMISDRAGERPRGQ